MAKKLLVVARYTDGNQHRTEETYQALIDGYFPAGPGSYPKVVLILRDGLITETDMRNVKVTGEMDLAKFLI